MSKIRIKLSTVNTYTEIVPYPSKEWNDIKVDLYALARKCEGDEKFRLGIGDLFIILRYKTSSFASKRTDKIIGFCVISHTNKLRKYKNYKDLGGLKSNGLFITSVCGDKAYQGVAKLLFYAIDKYQKNAKEPIKYLFLRVSRERPWVQNLYASFGFVNIEYLSKKSKEFVVMRRYY